MCKNCDPDYDDWNIETVNVDMGQLGEHVLDFLVSKKKKQLEISFGPVNREYIFEDTLDINYCPFCGERL